MSTSDESSTAPGTIRDIRERLLQARRTRDSSALPGLIEDVEVLARRGYRCCLVDFDDCRPTYYVRVVGFENARVTAEVEFPIEPEISPLQLVPLTHLVDYDEAAPQEIRSIYDRLSPFLHKPNAQLLSAPQRTPDEVRQDVVRPVTVRKRQDSASMTLWWTLASLLFVASLVVFVVA
jgi:hypothetical protein